MSEQQEIERLVDSWLADGPTQLPEHAIASIFTQLEQSKQRRSWWLPGGIQMNRMTLAIGGVAAIVIAVAATGIYLGRNDPGVGGSPSPAASDTPIETLAPAGLLQSVGAVAEGAYFHDRVTDYRYTFTVPAAGWSALGGNGVARGEETGDSPNFAGFSMWGPVASLYTDACHWGVSERTPTDGDFASAIARLEGFETSGPTDTNVGSHSAQHVRLTLPSGVNFSECDQDQYRSFEGRYYQGAGQVDNVWMVDLDGIDHLVFTSHLPGASADVVGQLEAMVQSLEIAPH